MKGEQGKDGKLARVIITYSYEIVRQVALKVRARAHWANNERVQELGLTDPWVRGF